MSKPPSSSPGKTQLSLAKFGFLAATAPDKATTTSTPPSSSQKKKRPPPDEVPDVEENPKPKRQKVDGKARPKEVKKGKAKAKKKAKADEEDDGDDFLPNDQDVESSSDGADADAMQIEMYALNAPKVPASKAKSPAKSPKKRIVEEDDMDEDEEEEEAKESKEPPNKAAAASSAVSVANLTIEQLKEHIESQPTNEKVKQKFAAKLKDRDEYFERRRQEIEAAGEGDEGDADAGDEEEKEKPKGKQAKASAGKPKYTPMEQQFLEIKKQHPDTILFVEAGYRYRFFGKDAEIASKVLNIVAGISHNFLGTSVPTHRLFVHAKRLVQAGYKVGVVRQTEKASLRAAVGKKSGPFTRALTELYTKSTLIDAEMDPLLESAETTIDTSSGVYLMALLEQAHAADVSKSTFAIATIKATTGEIVFDHFEDTLLRAELETRLRHIQPIELLLPKTTTEPTGKLLESYIATKGNTTSAVGAMQAEAIRVERMNDEDYDLDKAKEALDEAVYSSVETDNDKDEALKFLQAQPSLLIRCFGSLVKYLKDFGLTSVFALKCNYRSFTSSQYLKLDAKAIVNLEILKNQTDGAYRGSLVWVLDHCRTPFGRRQLTNWVKNPLTSKQHIEERLDAVEEVMKGEANDGLQNVLHSLLSLPDLERGITRIYYQKCTFDEFVTILNSFKKVSKLAPKDGDKSTKAPLLRSLLAAIPSELCLKMDGFLEKLNTTTKNPTKQQYFNPAQEHYFPQFKKCKTQIKEVEDALKKHLEELRRLMKISDLDFVSRNNLEYVIEIKNDQSKKIPKDSNFVFKSLKGTKALDRYHTDFIEEKVALLAQYRDLLAAEIDNAWNELLKEFSQHYTTLRAVIGALASLDCLMSLSVVARQEGFVKPKISTEHEITIEGGRHPIVETLLPESFVANDFKMGEKHKHTCSILTGPNMGGKSTTARQVALISIMAQVGSYVPAKSAVLTPLDGIYTRMGASDDEVRGQSTFFVELQETSTILSQATAKSLVILDELGRGTSTYDGFAIAYATLHYLVSQQANCFTIFITHYPGLSQLEKLFPAVVHNYHMGFTWVKKPPVGGTAAKAATLEEDDQDVEDDSQMIAFLYKLVRGVEPKSFGINVARLANLPPQVLQAAQKRSHQLEMEVRHRNLATSLKKLAAVCKATTEITAANATELRMLAAQFASLLELRK